MEKNSNFWHDSHKLRFLLAIFYALLVTLDFFPFISLFLGIFIFLSPVDRMPKLERSHFIWLRKTLLIYFFFTGLSALVLILSPASGASITGIIIFFIGFAWVELREIKGLVCLWQKRDPAQGIRLFDNNRP